MAQSSVVVHVGKAGFFSFAGHEHMVTAPRVKGEVRAAANDLSRSLVTLAFETGALRVEDKGGPAGDAAKVQEVMVGPRVLNATRSPTATFKSERVTGRATGSNAYDLTITGELSLHGVTRSVSLPLRVEIGGHTLKATGYVLLRQTECGISPVTVAAVVKVKDELTIDYVFVATKVIPQRDLGAPIDASSVALSFTVCTCVAVHLMPRASAPAAVSSASMIAADRP